MGKSERVEGQKSLYTADDPAGYICSATSLHRIGVFQIPISRARLQNPHQLYSSAQGFIADAELASSCVSSAEWPQVQLFSLVQIVSLCDR